MNKNIIGGLLLASSVVLLVYLVFFNNSKVSISVPNGYTVQTSNDQGKSFKDSSKVDLKLTVDNHYPTIAKITNPQSTLLFYSNEKRDGTLQLTPKQFTPSEVATNDKPLSWPLYYRDSQSKDTLYGINKNLAAISISRYDSGDPQYDLFFGAPASKKLVWNNVNNVLIVGLDNKVYHYRYGDVFDFNREYMENSKANDASSIDDLKAIVGTDSGVYIATAEKLIQEKKTNNPVVSVSYSDNNYFSLLKRNTTYTLNVSGEDLKKEQSVVIEEEGELIEMISHEAQAVIAFDNGFYITKGDNFYKYPLMNVSSVYYDDNGSLLVLNKEGVWLLDKEQNSLVLLSKIDNGFVPLNNSLTTNGGFVYWGNDLISGFDYSSTEPGFYSFRKIAY